MQEPKLLLALIYEMSIVENKLNNVNRSALNIITGALRTGTNMN